MEAVREEWVVEDRWWTGRPLRRRYFELVLADGRNVTVMRELTTGTMVHAKGLTGIALKARRLERPNGRCMAFDLDAALSEAAAPRAPPTCT